MISDSYNKFIYNGINSYDDMSMIITERPVITSTRRRITPTAVPGRTGDILIDDDGYENYERIYKTAILADNEPLNILEQKIKRYLLGNVNYHKLTDTYNPGYFFKAFIDTPFIVTPITHNLAEAEITFTCKAYKYSNRGLQSTAFTSTGKINNQEYFTSKPIIQIFGSGEVTLHINDNSYLIENCENGMFLNSEIGQAYNSDETTLLNNSIKFTDFPVFKSGWNTISWTGNVEKLLITPNWRSL